MHHLKTYFFLLLLIALALAVLFSSCNMAYEEKPDQKELRMSATIDSLQRVLHSEKEKREARRDFMMQKVELVDAIHRSLSKIDQHQLNISNNFNEIQSANVEKDQSILERIEQLKSHLKNTQKKLEKLKALDQSSQIQELKSTISALHNTIKGKSNEIDSLYTQIKHYQATIKEKDNQINQLAEKNDELNKENKALSRTYCYIISKKGDKKKFLLEKNLLELPYKKKNIEIVTQHPASSYIIKNEIDKLFKHKNVLVIHNREDFFSQTKKLIIRIDKRKL
ncbi:MAG: hypothetical protein ACOCWW_00465 [Bacteroidota bacterium]